MTGTISLKAITESTPPYYPPVGNQKKKNKKQQKQKITTTTKTQQQQQQQYICKYKNCRYVIARLSSERSGTYPNPLFLNADQAHLK